MTHADLIWRDVTTDYDREDGGERHIRDIDHRTYISVLHRMTGFGYMEWETAIVFVHENAKRFSDRDVLIIRGDRRDELATMPKDELRSWYAANIDSNRNSMDTIIECLKKGGTDANDTM